LFDRLLGAHVHFVEPANVDAAARTLLDDLKLLGRDCYVIPTGGSNAVGALGYMRCASEIIAQSRELGFTPDAIVHATSSGGTQAGLIAGLAAEEFDCEVIGINVYEKDFAAIERRIEQLVWETLTHAQIYREGTSRLRVVHDFLGGGYGIPTQRAVETIRVLAATEGVLTDLVYSGKALAALVSMIEMKGLSSANNVVFVHTGGVPSLSVYASAFESDQRYE
jgi:1-aminocyclopropane-1-carboxylate deaminase/D-cysteine desulfhydrase-like pyridoxal-dependent ACC family enzyme